MIANFWNGTNCELCPHNCAIQDGRYGFCGIRRNSDGVLYADGYGKISSVALDPIEKKPLYHFHPGGKIWSIGSHGCNMSCGFCQNHEISQRRSNFDGGFTPPEDLLRFIESRNSKGNIGAAFTYNEPTVNFEYVFDCAELLKQAGLKTVLVSNGQINAEPLKQLAPLIDAWNIDIKAWNPEFYSRHGGSFDAAVNTVETACKTAAHVEVTTLIIPGENDGDREIAALSEWLSEINPEIPYHLSRYFPRYKYDKPPTPKETLSRLADIARLYLRNVYVGNV